MSSTSAVDSFVYDYNSRLIRLLTLRVASTIMTHSRTRALIVSLLEVALDRSSYCDPTGELKMLSRWLMLMFVILATGAACAAEERFFDSNGVRICYLEQGQGEPVILIHGFTANSRLNWVLPGVVDALDDNFRVIALDMRGHGRSDKPHDSNQYGIELVHDVTRLMDHLQIARAHVVGYSMGAFITCKLLTTAPERLISVTLGGAGWPRAEDPRQATLDELAEALEKDRSVGPLLKALTPPGKPVPTDEQLRSTSFVTMMVNDHLALAALMRGRDGLLVPETDLRKSRLPVLALIGDQDPLKTSVDPLVGVLPKLQLVPIEGADHMSAFVNPQFRTVLLKFLESNRLHPKLESAGAVEAVSAGTR
ncbi:MAG: alpha/beta hydrolase [Pirellulaceae bacterium]|nr:alpha/beta hydrolase [Pirellulaceae bacterium]